MLKLMVTGPLRLRLAVDSAATAVAYLQTRTLGLEGFGRFEPAIPLRYHR